MQINNNAYKNYFFWENKIINESYLWEGYFENQSITEDSKIIYTGILDSEKNILHHGFVVYPSVYNLLGFLQHVFLPTAFFTWFEREADNFYIPLSSYPNVVDEVIENSNNIDLNLVNSMNNSYSTIENLWLFDEEFINLNLQSFCEKFNADWNNDPNQKLFIKVFNNPSDIFEFIKSSIEWSEYDEYVEEEISMSLDTLKFTCYNAIIEPLLNKNFIDILNTNMPILF